MTLIEKAIEPRKQIDESRKIFTDRMLVEMIVPVIIEQLLALMVGMADTMMVSYAGEAAVSGVALINQLINVFIMLFAALASGGAVIVSQYIGRDDKKNGCLASDQLMMLITIISICTTIIMLAFGSAIFNVLFGNVENSVYEAGMVYLKITAWSFPMLAWYNGCAGIFRSMSDTKTVMIVSFVMNGINVVGNAIGIFVLHAGVAGVAWPTTISRTVAAAVMLYLTFRSKGSVHISLKGILSWKNDMVKKIFGIAVPNGIENGLFQLSKVALSSIVALFGTMQIAANGVAQSFWSLAALFSIAMGPVFITVIGQCAGAQDREAEKYYSSKLMRITYLGAITWNVVTFALTPLLLCLFSLDSETVHLVIILCAIHNSGNMIFTPPAFALSSGMRAAGDVKYTMYAAIFSTVVCRVAFSILFAIVMKMGVIGIALAMVCDWAIKAAIILYKDRSGKWLEFNVIGNRPE